MKRPSALIETESSDPKDWDGPLPAVTGDAALVTESRLWLASAVRARDAVVDEDVQGLVGIHLARHEVRGRAGEGDVAAVGAHRAAGGGIEDAAAQERRGAPVAREPHLARNPVVEERVQEENVVVVHLAGNEVAGPAGESHVE